MEINGYKLELNGGLMDNGQDGTWKISEMAWISFK